LFTAFDTADLITFINILAAFFGIFSKISKASCIFFHFTSFDTSNIFLSDIVAYFNIAVIFSLLILYKFKLLKSIKEIKKDVI